MPNSFLSIPARPKRVKPLVAIGILTRNRPGMLARLLEEVERARRTTICDTHLMVWNNGDEPVVGQTHGVGFNVGQHVSMNRMIDEASKMEADYFLRIDEDCVFQTRNWLAKMVRLSERHQRDYGRGCVLSPFVHGLRHPPRSMGDVTISGKRCQIVSMLGGICRLMPMSLLRYWRFDERMPMGWSEASTFAKYCILLFVPMLRCVNIEVSHGGSTDEQEKADPLWAYEHDMLQLTPFGL